MSSLSEKQNWPENYSSEKGSASVVPSSSPSKIESYDTTNDYNPFEHRVVDKPNTTFGALIHILKGSLGAGILAIPNAFNNAGLLFGSVMIFIIGAVITHCAWVLVSLSHKICRISHKPVLRYSETAEKVFEHGPPWAKRHSKGIKTFIDYALMVGNLSSGCVYIVFVANTFHDILNNNLGWELSVRVYILITMVPIMMIGQIRTLKFLVPFSALANAFIIATLGIVLFYIFRETLVFDDKPLIVSFTKWPFFVTTVMYALDGIGAVMPVENSMKEPDKFLGKPSVLLIAMSFITVIYLIIGFFGFVRFGDGTKGSITLNLPTDEWTGTTGQSLIGLAILFAFGLSFYIVTEILFKRIEHKIAKSRNISEIVIRTSILICMGGLGLAVPDVGIFVSLVGSFYSSALAVFMPVFIEIIYLKTHGGFGKFYWKLIKNLVIMAFAVLSLLTGTFTSIRNIIDTYR